MTTSQEGSSPRCANCGTSNTPLWRRNELGQSICNACGLYFKTKKMDRPRSLEKGIVRKKITKTIYCTNCGTNSTSLWRRNESGESVCNACGLYEKLHGVSRPNAYKAKVMRKRNRYPPQLQQQHQQQSHYSSSSSSSSSFSQRDAEQDSETSRAGSIDYSDSMASDESPSKTRRDEAERVPEKGKKSKVNNEEDLERGEPRGKAKRKTRGGQEGQKSSAGLNAANRPATLNPDHQSYADELPAENRSDHSGIFSQSDNIENEFTKNNEIAGSAGEMKSPSSGDDFQDFQQREPKSGGTDLLSQNSNPKSRSNSNSGSGNLNLLSSGADVNSMGNSNVMNNSNSQSEISPFVKPFESPYFPEIPSHNLVSPFTFGNSNSTGTFSPALHPLLLPPAFQLNMNGMNSDKASSLGPPFPPSPFFRPVAKQYGKQGPVSNKNLIQEPDQPSPLFSPSLFMSNSGVSDLKSRGMPRITTPDMNDFKNDVSQPMPQADLKNEKAESLTANNLLGDFLGKNSETSKETKRGKFAPGSQDDRPLEVANFMVNLSSYNSPLLSPRIGTPDGSNSQRNSPALSPINSPLVLPMSSAATINSTTTTTATTSSHLSPNPNQHSDLPSPYLRPNPYSLDPGYNPHLNNSTNVSLHNQASKQSFFPPLSPLFSPTPSPRDKKPEEMAILPPLDLNASSLDSNLPFLKKSSSNQFSGNQQPLSFRDFMNE